MKAPSGRNRKLMPTLTNAMIWANSWLAGAKKGCPKTSPAAEA